MFVRSEEYQSIYLYMFFVVFLMNIVYGYIVHVSFGYNVAQEVFSVKVYQQLNLSANH